MTPILYFGDPRGAAALLEREIPLCAVVFGRRGGPGRVQLSRKLPPDVCRLTLPDLSDPKVVAQLAALKPGLIVSAFYPRRIPKEILALAPGLNVHPSDLPRFRGPDPCSWAIRAGDTTTALCVHELTEGLDEGALLVREPVTIGPKETGGALSERLEARGAVLMAEVVARLLAGESIPPTPQTGEVTWAPLVEPESLELDWQRPAEELARLVRAYSPDPCAFTGIGNELLVVHEAYATEAGPFAALPPGTPFVHQGDCLIRCQEGALLLKKVRLGRRAMTGKALAALLI